MIARDVADQLHLIDRAVTTLARSTEALLRASDEVSLLEDICKIAVEVAGYRLAWVGFADDGPGRPVNPVAAGGDARGYLDGIQVSWNDDRLGRGPTGTAIREGQPQVVIDTESDPAFQPWREGARRFGFRSVIALPLSAGGAPLGALTIYAGEPMAFDHDETRLLEDVARNLSYGIATLRMRAEHERAVQALAESEERYRTLIEMTPDAIIVHAEGTILFANQACERIFATGGRPMEGMDMLALVGEEARRAIAARIASPPDGRVLAEHPMLRLDGTAFDAEVVGTGITFHGVPARFLVIRDVTERNQVQQQLVQAAKLATLGEMAAGLVHELSQPLNIIRLTAEGALLFIERGKATPEWQAQQFQLVADQAQRTAEIIDDIRIFSRRDSSPVQVFDAVAAVRSALGVLENQLRPDDIVLVTELTGTPMPVRGRRVQLEQVVMNLLSNAHHALKEMREREGRATQAEIRLSARRKGRNVVIKIADSGPGIPPAVQARIFEPFFTTKEAGRGTGLGLSVSFGIVNSMGGRLEVVDQPKGACLAITLPLDADTPQVPEPAEVASPVFAGEGHVMVVDDESAAAETLGRYLGELGYRVTLSANGADAYDTFMRDPADVVITDLRMPSGNGEQLVERLRDFDPLLPIVIVTGHLGATERLADSLQDDRCAVMKKPVALGKLGELVATFLQPPSD
ncbi:ATP-binding protein [Magnetospirillum sp. UT-4]|uniref:ATP-binding protein n=1 Tax=Magnetospirillum sp. UT-4 TaxID=2681467 RepID=UPI0020C5AA63|nr:ATP-binding protein [Magnetospirillum sp. UT-4]